MQTDLARRVAWVVLDEAQPPPWLVPVLPLLGVVVRGVGCRAKEGGGGRGGLAACVKAVTCGRGMSEGKALPLLLLLLLVCVSRAASAK